jgi:hypothetical protein
MNRYILIIVVIFFALATQANAELYKYIDENGTIVFTDDISKVPENQWSNVKKDRDLHSGSNKSANKKPNDIESQILKNNTEQLDIESQKLEIDKLLRNVWSEMKNRLINRDINGVLRYFHFFSKKEYEKVFTIIEDNAPGGISAEAKKLPDPILVKIIGHKATYILSREEDGRMFENTLLFAKDIEGSWKIVEY